MTPSTMRCDIWSHRMEVLSLELTARYCKGMLLMRWYTLFGLLSVGPHDPCPWITNALFEEVPRQLDSLG